MALIDRAIWQLEMRREGGLTLGQLADLCGVSPFHLSRTFQASVGIGPMAYLRARRLSEAARRLAGGAGDILGVALDAGYGSHEAFARAFAAHFGLPPRELRARGTTEGLVMMEALEMKKDMIVEVPAPELRDHPGMEVVGLSIRCRFDDVGGIPGLWQAFNAREAEIEGHVAGAAYGLCYGGDDDGFRYMAGVAAKGAALPEGMERLQVPPGRYAVFAHKGHVSDLPKTVYTIWNKALGEAGLMARPAPDFELYDTRFDVETGRGTVEIWIPVDRPPQA